MKEFVPLREEAEKRGKLVKAARERHAASGEACKLIGNYSQAEVTMIKFIESNQTTCGIPAQVGASIRIGHKNTEALLKKDCAAAQQAAQQLGLAGPVGNFD